MTTEIVIIVSGGTVQEVMAKGDAQFGVRLIDLDIIDDEEVFDRRNSEADRVLHPKSGYRHVEVLED